MNGTLSPSEASWCEMQTAVHIPRRPLVRPAPYTLARLFEPCQQCHDNARLSWRLHVYKYICWIGAIICGVASAVVLWSELVMGTKLNSPMGALLTSVAADSQLSSGAISFFLQLIIFGSICYVSLCTYWSLFRINIGWAYTLQGPHMSPASSLIFNAMYFSRLQFAIGYNFLLFLNVER